MTSFTYDQFVAFGSDSGKLLCLTHFSSPNVVTLASLENSISPVRSQNKTSIPRRNIPSHPTHSRPSHPQSPQNRKTNILQPASNASSAASNP